MERWSKRWNLDTQLLVPRAASPHRHRFERYKMPETVEDGTL
jgi:hypothetical protein